MNLTRRNFGFAALGAGAALWPGLANAAPMRNWRSGFSTPPDVLESNLTLVSGRHPVGLDGALFRNGPAQFERAGERLGHWFDGDGMVQRFAIGEAGVRHRGRFVDTLKRRAEADAGRFLFGGYGFGPIAAAPFSHPDAINAANTSILPVGEEIWALWEGGSPWRLDPVSLQTIARRDFPGEADGLIFSAHPKREPDGEIWNFGGMGARCVIWRLSPEGQLRSVRPISLPASTLMHDFAVTENHIVLLAPPLYEMSRPATSVIDRFDWRPEQPLLCIVLDKADLAVRRVHELPGRFLYHVGNAWEDAGGTIRIDACLAGDVRFATEVARQLPQGVFAEPPYAEPTLLTLYRDGRSVMEGVGQVGEFPRVHPRIVGRRHQYTWSVLPHGLARWDWRSGRHQRYDYGERYWPEEPIFVPREQASAEDDGWIVTTRLDMEDGRTEVLVFDARTLGDGPIATYRCPYAVPLGFHGAFVSEST